ncbi:hypothetical protein [Streptomyces chrestomyceticus]|uniref:hypothetical protein n=1 Tax=Streptomyces chrestomyceticus TaxID=68185 RepID=UPI003790F87C
MAGSTGVRVPDVLHAAFTLLVHRYSGQDDFASARAGGTSSGRPVAVRSRIAEDETLAAMAAELGARYRRAAAEAGPDETAGLGTGLRVGHVESDGSAGLPEGFALLLHSERTPDGHRFTLHHDTGLLADELVARMAANLVTLLRDAVRRPETPATRCPKSCTTRWPSRCRPPSTSGSRSASRSPRTSATTTCPN